MKMGWNCGVSDVRDTEWLLSVLYKFCWPVSQNSVFCTVVSPVKEPSSSII